MLPLLAEKLNLVEKINDKTLKTKVLETWLDGMVSGGWQLNDLDKIPFTLLVKDTKISLLTHTLNVTKIALCAGETLNATTPGLINMEHLTAGALLHDVGKLLEYQFKEGKYIKSFNGTYIRHPFSGASLATKHGLPEPVIHIIANHAKEGNLSTRSKEAILVYHSDFITFEPFENSL